MREVLYKTTQRYYDLDINFIKHQGSKNNVKRKGEFISPVAHLPKCTLFACQNFAQALFSISLWTAVKWGGQTRCIKGAVQMANGPFPSYRYKYSHLRNKAHYRTFLVKMSFICIRIKTRENVAHSLLIKNHCHMNGFALSLALKHRLGATWK